MKFISSYEAILNRKNDTASKISNIEPVKSMIELLELVIIRRTSGLREFGKTMIELPLHI